MRNITLITPKWSVPRSIVAYSTTRYGGMSQPPYGLADNRPGGLNLASHVDDNLIYIAENRRRLRELTKTAPIWLNQSHSTKVIQLNRDANPILPHTADASFTLDSGVTCGVLTADCLPILVTDKWAQFVGAIHAGWRGLAHGIIEETMTQIIRANAEVQFNDCLAWLGPAIGPKAFEVGAEVKALYLTHSHPDDVSATEAAFVPNIDNPEHYFANLYDLARIRLKRLGFAKVWGGDHCTYTEPSKFYSYRRDGRTGRMLSAIMKRS